MLRRKKYKKTKSVKELMEHTTKMVIKPKILIKIKNTRTKGKRLKKKWSNQGVILQMVYKAFKKTFKNSILIQFIRKM